MHDNPPLLTRFPLAVQLAVVLVMLVSVGLTVLGSIGYQRQVIAVETAGLRTAGALTDIVRNNIAEDIYNSNYAALERTLLGLDELQDLRSATVYGPDGLILSEVSRNEQGRLYATYRYGRVGKEQLVTFTGYVTGGSTLVRVPVSFAGSDIAWFEYAGSSEHVEEQRLAAFRENLLWTLALLSVSGLAIVIFLVRRLHPLTELVAFARSLPSHSGTGLREMHNSKELDELAATLNWASREIARQQKQLQDNNAILEQRVVERTQDLELARNQAEAARKMAELARDLADQARETAERASQAKSDFLSSMSHELRTPLNAILGFTQLLDMDGGKFTPQQRQDFVEEIRDSGMHLLELINDILDLTRIEGGYLRLHLQELHLASTLEACINQTRAALSRNPGVTIENLAFDSDLILRADPTRFRQVMINLLSNAVKYNRDNGSVTVDAKPEGNQVCITVSDTGRGIAPEDMSKLFDPFERLAQKFGNIEGSGIGLSVTRQLVEAMGGRIEAQSTPGVGSVFSVHLPAWKADPDAPVSGAD